MTQNGWIPWCADDATRRVSGRLAGQLSSLTELKALRVGIETIGQSAWLADGSQWVYSLASTLDGDDVLVVQPTGSALRPAPAGRWLRAAGPTTLMLPISSGTPDATILLTIPAGCLLRPKEFSWRVAADFTGGASSAIGVSSSNKAGYTTKGDLLGGAAGDVAGTLVASSGLSAPGTIGAQWGTIALRRPFWKPTETFRFDRITSAFASGSGFVLAAVDVLQNVGA